MSDNVNHGSQDASEQIAQLREQVQSLMSDRVAPVLSQAADTAQQYASQARDMYEDQSEALSERIRSSPIMAVWWRPGLVMSSAALPVSMVIVHATGQAGI